MDQRIEILARRARRLRADGDFRKAANAYGELTSVEPGTARWWVLLGAMLRESNRVEPALKALRQAAYLQRRSGETVREATTRRLLVGFASGSAAIAA